MGILKHMNACKICNGALEKIFDKVVLNKYTADYLRCSHCHFVQTSEPIWIKEAYSSAITSLDIGLISRNLYLRETIRTIIDSFFPDSKLMLDYGGGYGMFVRLMRDLGYGKGYLYSHDYPNNFIEQEFLPEEIKNDE